MTIFVSVSSLAREIELKVSACKSEDGVICSATPRIVLDRRFDLKLMDPTRREKADPAINMRLKPQERKRAFEDAMKQIDEARFHFQVAEFKMTLSGTTGGDDCIDEFSTEQDCLDSATLSGKDELGHIIGGSDFVLTDRKLSKHYLSIQSKRGEVLFISVE